MPHKSNYYAHSAGKGGLFQFMAEHLTNVAEMAAEFARSFGLQEEGRLSGLLHDVGKYGERSQQRLVNGAIHGINHWAAGTVLADGLVRYAVDGHHTGLSSASDVAQTRKKAENIKDWQELTGCQESIDELMARFSADGLVLPAPTIRPPSDNFANALRTRFLFSCLVDADFIDTSRHFRPQGMQDREVPLLSARKASMLVLAHLDRLQRKMADGPVKQLRRQLLEDCLASAILQPGLFTLTSPTGSGKTLASLVFALEHAATHHKSRVIYVVPYTCIIEQTARVLRKIFMRSLGLDYVLEHHSAVIPRETRKDSTRVAEERRLARARLAFENWASPLVVTTSVQFFESLFSNSPFRCRKLHNIANSVIIFDEVQTLPAHLVPSLLSAVRLLVRDYGATALFMTATQPAFTSINKAALPYGWNPTEISSNPKLMAETMKRTRIVRGGSFTSLEMATELGGLRQALCVVNTVKDAREIFHLLPMDGRYHLSSRMCPAHRLKVLTEIRRRLARNKPCRLVSTQLIEAGVDIDFVIPKGVKPIVYRAEGPLDSYIQTAGRCNREGRNSEPQPVIFFYLVGGGTPGGAYKTATEKTREFLSRHPNSPLHLPSTYADYFAELYRLLGPDKAESDKVFELSSSFEFAKAADACRLIEEETHGVMVRWGEGKALVEKLCRDKHLTSDECRRVQRFSVGLHDGEFEKAVKGGWVIQPTVDMDFFVWNSNYDEETGACHPEGPALIV